MKRNVLELKTQFIISESGITPCSLVQVNGEKVWRSFMGIIGVPANEFWPTVKMLREKNSWLWQRDNLWEKDKDIRSWYKTHKKTAANIEAILDSNPMCRGLTCSIIAWRQDDTSAKNLGIEEPVVVRTTAEFDSWINKVKPILSAPNDGVYILPAIDFGVKYLESPCAPDMLYFLKRKGWYISEVTEDGITWHRDVHRAKVLTGIELHRLRREYSSCRSAYAVDASRARYPFNAIVHIVDGAHAGEYIEKIDNDGQAKFSPYTYFAMRYRTEDQAHRARNHILKKNPSITAVEVVITP